MELTHIPLLLNIQARPCLIIGGGKVALRRARKLLEHGAHVTVIAPNIDPALIATAAICHERLFHSHDLDPIFLCVIATSCAETNQNIAQLCADKNILCNRSDQGEQGDAIFPVSRHKQGVTLSVYSGNSHAAWAVKQCERLLADIPEEDFLWLAHCKRWRKRLQQDHSDDHIRQKHWQEVTSDACYSLLLSEGTQALQVYCETLYNGKP